MQVHKDIERLPTFSKAVITIGTFDGVHLGHQKILALLKEEAVSLGGETVILTFHPHPRKIIKPHDKTVKLINTIEERIMLLEQQGIDHLVIIPFTGKFSMLSAREYVEHFLTERFHPECIIIGYDHHFGHDRLGDYLLLEEYSRNGVFSLREIPQHVISDVTVSSTRIRKAIHEGEMTTAKTLLGYDFFFEGRVVEGDKRGRTIGFPTANLRIDDEEKLLPGKGVYVVTASLDTESTIGDLKGMMNIGTRPTVDGIDERIEVNLFDFDQDIYGRKLKVWVKDLLRHEQKFNGLDELKAQLAKDKSSAINSFIR